VSPNRSRAGEQAVQPAEEGSGGDIAVDDVFRATGDERTTADSFAEFAGRLPPLRPRVGRSTPHLSSWGVAVTLRESRDYLPRAVAVEQDAVLGVPDDRAGVRAVLYRRALAVSLQLLRHTGARDEAARLIRRNILQQVLVEALG
jgi:hypothetical protein